jgi:hypothetical protein
MLQTFNTSNGLITVAKFTVLRWQEWPKAEPFEANIDEVGLD